MGLWNIIVEYRYTSLRYLSINYGVVRTICLLASSRPRVDIFDKFQTCSSVLDKNRIIQVSADGPNFNLTFLDLLR